MQIRNPGWSETWRVLAYTVAIALGFVALGRLQLAGFRAFGDEQALARWGLIDGQPEDKLREQAALVAAESSQALLRLPAGHRLATLRLGYGLGYTSQLTGAFAMSSPDVQAKVHALGQPHLQFAREQALLLGLGDVAALPVRSLKEFTELNQRYEADPDGLAARVQSTLSPLHRHLYLLGVHLGTESARVEGSAGQLALPPASLIRLHATLAGVPPALWKPLTVAPRNDEPPPQVLGRYRAALAALAAGLEQPPVGGASPPAR
jgi:hypothetical protein